MRINVTGSIVHRCPFRDELDVGQVKLDYELGAADEVEFYALRSFLDGFAARAMTHEEVTAAVAAQYPHAAVVTRWSTAGLDVVIEAGPYLTDDPCSG